jgi:hypothetical protein
LGLVVCSVAMLGLGCAGAGDPLVVAPDAGSPDVSPPDADHADADHADAGGGDAGDFARCNPPALTYANFGQAFLTGYCGACHSFDQTAVQSSGSGLASVVTSGFMPRGNHQPSALERSEFAAWVACGAP